MKIKLVLLIMSFSTFCIDNPQQVVADALQHIESNAHNSINAAHQQAHQAVHSVVEHAKQALHTLIENIPHDQVVHGVRRNMFDYVEHAAHKIEELASQAIQDIEQHPQDGTVIQDIISDVFYELQQATQSVVVTASSSNMQVPATTLVIIKEIIPTISIDNRYASQRNITGKKLFSARLPLMLSYKTACCLAEVQKDLETKGFGLIVWQAHQSDEQQEQIGDMVQNTQLFSQCPAVSQGRKLSVSMYRLDNARQATMPTDFQDFSIQSKPDCTAVSAEALRNRQILTDTMKKQGFEQSSYYWWSFYLPKALAQ